MVVFLFIISSILLPHSGESSELVIGQLGESVTLPCKYETETHGVLNTCWGRHQSWFSCENTLISTDGLHVSFRESSRFSLTSELNRGNVSLTIKSAQKRDSGLYVCRVEIPGPFNDISHSVYLIIRRGLNINTDTQLPPTLSKQQKHAQTQSPDSTTASPPDPNTLRTEPYVTPQTPTPAGTSTTDGTDVYISEPIAVAHTQETLEMFVINVVRVGAVVFIPGLIIAFLTKLRRRAER